MDFYNTLWVKIHEKLNELKSAFEQNGNAGISILRTEVSIPDTDPALWLAPQVFGRKFFWKNRMGDMSIAACGTALSLNSESEAPDQDAFSELYKFLDENTRAYGGIKFDCFMPVDEYWDRFAYYYFFIPKFELLKEQSDKLAYNLLIDDDFEVLEQRIESDFKLIALPVEKLDENLVSPYTRNDYPDKKGWKENINLAYRFFGFGDVKKIVLSRRSEIYLDKDISPIAIFNVLNKMNPDAFCFYCEIDEKNIFLGASPERLYIRHFREIKSDALAGTRPRGANEIVDKELEEELINSAKDIQEHAYVLDCIKNAYEGICETRTDNGDTVVRKYVKVQHLFNEISGILKFGLNDLDIIRKIHPTPAVGGIPAKKSMGYLRDIEQYDRGWYAAPIGWLSKDKAEFAVGIRSGLIKDNRLILYAGAGIVNGSDPESEWNEIDNKLMNFLRIFE